MSKATQLLSACLLAGCVSHARAQPATQHDFTENQRAHDDDTGDHPIPEKALPAVVSHEHLHQGREAWVCIGVNPFSAVYEAPGPSSRIIGRTQPQAAVTGDPVNGFFSPLSPDS
jgi:hypothetical protein